MADRSTPNGRRRGGGPGPIGSGRRGGRGGGSKGRGGGGAAPPRGQTFIRKVDPSPDGTWHDTAEARLQHTPQVQAQAPVGGPARQEQAPSISPVDVEAIALGIGGALSSSAPAPTPFTSSVQRFFEDARRAQQQHVLLPQPAAHGQLPNDRQSGEMDFHLRLQNLQLEQQRAHEQQARLFAAQSNPLGLPGQPSSPWGPPSIGHLPAPIINDQGFRSGIPGGHVLPVPPFQQDPQRSLGSSQSRLRQLFSGTGDDQSRIGLNSAPTTQPATESRAPNGPARSPSQAEPIAHFLSGPAAVKAPDSTTETSVGIAQKPVLDREEGQGRFAGAPTNDKGQSKENTHTDGEEKQFRKHNRPEKRLLHLQGRLTVNTDAAPPKGPLKVTWELPRELFKENETFVGLFRVGQNKNDSCITNRKALIPKRSHERVWRNVINFRAPRTVGKFEFRLYYAASGEKGGGAAQEAEIYENTANLAISNMFSVDVHGEDLLEAVDFVRTKLAETDSVMSGVSQLSRVLEQLREVSPGVFSKYLWPVIEESVDKSLRLLSTGWPSKTSRELESTLDAIQSLVHAAETCRACRSYLQGHPSQRLMEWGTLLMHKLFLLLFQPDIDKPKAKTEENADLLEQPQAPLTPSANVRKEEDPTLRLVLPVFMARNFYTAFSQLLLARASELLPGPDFDLERLNLRNRLQQELVSKLPWQDVTLVRLTALSLSNRHHRQSPMLFYPLLWLNNIAPLDVRLVMFGSSANGFGSAGSDVDMCLSFPSTPKEEIPPASEVIGALVELLEQHHMQGIEDRKTARVPIVLFEDSESSLHCDVCMENPLAIRNTWLLRTYATADPRLRQLGYIVKLWSKRRRMNNPSEGTLSSYGFILMLINFLQQRQPPVLPPLQNIPPDWNGEPAAILCGERGKGWPLPRVPVQGPDGDVHETYFYQPAQPNQLHKLQSYCRRNGEPIGFLLVCFFQYYGFIFDYGRQVVSVRTGQTVDKDEKTAKFSWKRLRRLSIEDPFEISYDVAHVIKDPQQKYIRQEFCRAYRIMSDAHQQAQSLEAALERLLEAAEDPPFVVERDTAAEEALPTAPDVETVPAE